MGRFIDLSRPITDEEREYLKSRSREGEIMVNDRAFGHLKDEEKDEEREVTKANDDEERKEQEEFEAAVKQAEEDSYPEHLIAKVEPLTVNQLKTALKKRDLETSGNRDELRVRLITFLEEQEEVRKTKGVGDA